MSGDCDMCGQPSEVCDVCNAGDRFARVGTASCYLPSDASCDNCNNALCDWQAVTAVKPCGLWFRSQLATTDPATDAGLTILYAVQTEAPVLAYTFTAATASVDPIQWIPRKMCRIEKVRWVETGAQLRHNQWRREYARPMRKRMKRLSAIRRQGRGRGR